MALLCVLLDYFTLVTGVNMALSVNKGKSRKRKAVRATPKRKQGGKLEEPNWEGASEWSGEKFHRFSQWARDWYYQNYKTTDLVNYVFDWMKLNSYTKEQIKAAKAVPHYEISSTAGISARLILKGMPLIHEEHNKYWDSLPGTTGTVQPADAFLRKRIDLAIEKGVVILKDKKVEEDKKVKVTGLSIQQKMHEASVKMSEPIEDALELLCVEPDKFNLKEFDPLKLFRREQIKPNHARIIKKWYADPLAEYEELLGPKKKDDDWYDQLIEGYRHMDKKLQKTHHEAYKRIVGACDIVIGEAKLTRKPRKSRPKPVEKQVEKLKYCKSDVKLGLASVPPAEIIGAEYLFVYNVKNRKLGMYVSSNNDPQHLGRGGFSVKGTTIGGFVEDQSLQKTLRKPQEQIKLFTGTRAKAVKEFGLLKTTETKLNGRFNEHCIILKAFK
tara:strand:- start:463 stop:1788 length:1326 start_codon:yes stop_codon:yes gene_type:complete